MVFSLFCFSPPSPHANIVISSASHLRSLFLFCVSKSLLSYLGKPHLSSTFVSISLPFVVFGLACSMQILLLLLSPPSMHRSPASPGTFSPAQFMKACGFLWAAAWIKFHLGEICALCSWLVPNKFPKGSGIRWNTTSSSGRMLLKKKSSRHQTDLAEGIEEKGKRREGQVHFLYFLKERPSLCKLPGSCE